jgi:hypothetical protein
MQNFRDEHQDVQLIYMNLAQSGGLYAWSPNSDGSSKGGTRFSKRIDPAPADDSLMACRPILCKSIANPATNGYS